MNALGFLGQKLPNLHYPQFAGEFLLVQRAPFDVTIHRTEFRGWKGAVEMAGESIYIKDFKYTLPVGVYFMKDFDVQGAMNKL